MNANRLFKLLNRDKETFRNLETYHNILKSSSHLYINFTNFINFDAFIAKSLVMLKNNKLNVPVDNILLDIDGVTATKIEDGTLAAQSLTMHLLPIQIATDVSTFNVMLVQDMRELHKDIFTRTHIVSMSPDKIMYMPSFDEGMKDIGSKCALKNAFSHNPIFNHIQSFTPGFVADTGYALHECKENKACEALANMSKNICEIAIASLVFVSLPCHRVVKIIDNSMKVDGLRNMARFELFDTNRWTNLQNGKLVDLSTTDGNNIDETPATFSGKIETGSLVYEVL